MTKRSFLSFFVAAFLLCIAVLIGIVPNTIRKTSHAATTDLSDTDYTNSDYLLLENGTPSTKTIQNFVEEVIQASPNDPLYELPEVLPRDFLETSLINAVRQYYGKEYGYYIVKEGEYFDALLIDFKYRPLINDESANEYTIEIKPILQESFIRETNSIGYVWKKSTAERYKYYVAYPRFLTALKNENAWNYGDARYVKEEDEGLIIQQSRANFGKVLYKTEKDWADMQMQFMAESMVDLTVDGLDMVLEYFTGVGGVLGFIKDRIEHEIELIEYSKEVVVKADNEANICTNSSKSVQRTNGKASYSRVVGFKPQEEIILSSDVDSYANFITVLDDTDYRSRLYQICEFDIVRRKGLYDSMEHVAGNYYDESARSIFFEREQVLFEDQAPQRQLTEDDFHESEIPLYLLPHGQQYFHFRPQYSGDYSFDLPYDLSITIDGAEVVDKGAGYSAYLSENKPYTIIVHNDTTHKAIGMLKCSIAQYGDRKFTVGGNQNYLVQYIPTQSGYKLFSSENLYTTVKILNSNFELIDNSNAGGYCYFKAGERYYILVENLTQYPVESRLSDSSPAAVESDRAFSLTEDHRIVSFTNKYNSTLQFTFSLDSNTAQVLNSSNASIARVSSNGTRRIYSFSLPAKMQCYIIFDHAVDDAVTCIYLENNYYKWEIDGEITGNDITLKSENEETSHIIRLVSEVNGIVGSVDTIYKYNPVDNAAYIEYDPVMCKLTIKKQFSGRGSAELHTELSSAPALIIHVWDYKVKVTYKQENPDNSSAKDFTKEAIYDEPLPNIKNNVTERPGYSFSGFYTEPNGEGRAYYDSDFSSESCDRQESFTLYAYWEKIYYTVRLYLTEDERLSEIVKVAYGDIMPDLYFVAPKRKGYEFVGYYSGKNGTGVKYYSMEIKTEQSYDSSTQVPYTLYYEGLASTGSWDHFSDGVLYPYWKLLECDYIYYDMVLGEGNLGQTEVHLKHGESITITANSYKGYKFLYFLRSYTEYPTTTEYHSTSVTWEMELYRGDRDGKIYPVDRFYAVYEKDSSCIAAGTLITLADGSQKPVEELTGDEMLLVWNMFTGQFDAAPIVFIDTENESEYEVISLDFSNGTAVKVISEHGFWDYNLNRYVYLDRNAAQYIGHWFRSQTTDEDGNMVSERVRLTDVTVQTETIAVYSPVTYGHLCYYVNGMLSMPGGIEGLFNIFEVDPDTMCYDFAQMQADIEEYGLFTYEEFAESVPVSREVFEAFNGQYLKVAIGKGLIDIPTLEALAARYAKFFD